MIPILLLLSFLLLSGCLYPVRKGEENFTTLTFQINTVSEACLQYQKVMGSLPVMAVNEKEPIYEQYRIDFSKLYPNFLSSLPPNAFERGGRYLYVLYPYGDQNEVKLIDLTISNHVQELQQKVHLYAQEKGVYPMKRTDSPYQYEIDYAALGMKEPAITSPFTGKPLHLFLSPKGETLIDYAPDIHAYLEKGYPFQGEDARRILLENSYFVPVKSYAYRLEGKALRIAPDLPR